MTATKATIVSRGVYGDAAPSILSYMMAEGYRYDIHCLDAPPTTPGLLSDYYDGRDWQFRGLAAAKRACERCSRDAARRGDGLRFVVVDLRAE